jgi:hypothetical protein
MQIPVYFIIFVVYLSAQLKSFHLYLHLHELALLLQEDLELSNPPHQLSLSLQPCLNRTQALRLINDVITKIVFLAFSQIFALSEHFSLNGRKPALALLCSFTKILP